MERLTTGDVVLPSQWQGERGCTVGPFSSREVATYFVHYVLNLNYVVTDGDCVFAKGDAWYIRVSDAAAPKPRPAAVHRA